MAQKIDINNFGNQTLNVSLNGQTYLFDFDWDGRNNRYMLEIINRNTFAVAKAQSVEPYSAMDISFLDFGDNFLIPIMSNPIYDEEGEIVYQYEDLGTALVIALFAPAELPALNVYGEITTL